MSSVQTYWTPYCKVYNPLEAGSIDRTDTEPHDKAIARALSANYTPNPNIKGRPEYTIFVARLNLKTTENVLRRHFSEFGEIQSCSLIRDIVTGVSKGYAFIEFKSRSSVEEAIRQANKTELDGRIVFVDNEIGRTMEGWIPRRFGGGFGGNKNSGQLRFGGRDRPFLKPISRKEQPREEQPRYGRR